MAQKKIKEVKQEKYSKGIEEFLRFLTSAKEAYNISASVQDETEDMTQDLLHQLELGENSYHEIAQLGIRTADARRERRAAKNTIQQLQPLMDWMQNNQVTIRGLEKLLGQMRKEELHTNPELMSYNYKTDIVNQAIGRQTFKKEEK